MTEELIMAYGRFRSRYRPKTVHHVHTYHPGRGGRGRGYGQRGYGRGQGFSRGRRRAGVRPLRVGFRM
jgi:hypothetical protein